MISDLQWDINRWHTWNQSVCVLRAYIAWKPAMLYLVTSKYINWNCVCGQGVLTGKATLLVNTRPIHWESTFGTGKPGESAKEGHEHVLTAATICHERMWRPGSLLQHAMCCWIRLLPCRLRAKECVNRPYSLASVPQNVAQPKMPLDVSFPSWPSSQPLTVSQQKKIVLKEI